MSRPPIQTFKLTEHLELSECHPDSECRTNSWWLYDTRAGMNLGLRAKTKEEAFVNAIDYWAKRFIELKREHDFLQTTVYGFVNAVAPKEETDDGT